MIFWRTLKKHIRTNGAVTVWLVIGVIVCAYCISVMLGMATGQYQLATRSNTEASLTIDIEDADIQAEEISAYSLFYTPERKGYPDRMGRNEGENVVSNYVWSFF